MRGSARSVDRVLDGRGEPADQLWRRLRATSRDRGGHLSRHDAILIPRIERGCHSTMPARMYGLIRLRITIHVYTTVSWVAERAFAALAALQR